MPVSQVSDVNINLNTWRDLMKKVTKEVKSKGEVVDTIEVVQYGTVAEAEKALTSEKILEMINKVVSDSACNAARTAKVRPTSAGAQLARIAKSDPKMEKEIEALLKRYQKAE